MRRRRNKRRLVIKLIIALAIMLVVGTGYAYLSSVLTIRGNVKGTRVDSGYTIDPDSNPNLAVSVDKTGQWTEGNLDKYQYRFNVTNIGNESFDNFKITIIYNNKIESASVWNYGHSIDKKVLVITNDIYHLEANDTVEVGFIVAARTSSLEIISIKLEAETTPGEVGTDQFNVVFTITGGWGKYTYQYDVTVTNNTGSDINYWQLDVILPQGTSYKSGWNGMFEEHDNTLIIKNTSYNGRLRDGESTNFGLQLSTNIVNYIPSNIKVMVR